MRKTILMLSLVLTVGGVSAQHDLGNGALLDGKTIVKANALGLATRNFGFYGERIINKNISAVVGVNFMPKGKVPYIDKFTEDVLLHNIQASSFAFTPEVRIYLGKGYGKGFYIAPYYKYERFNADNFIFSYGENEEITLKGDLYTHGIGAVLGLQWLFGKNKNIALDWTIIGAHYGANKADFLGKSTHTLSAQEQAEIKKEIEDTLADIPIIKDKIITVDANSAQAELKGPWAFIRSSLSIGFRF